MRKILIFSVALLTTTLLCASCQKDDSNDFILADIAPITIQLRVQSESGIDLLNPNNEGYIPNESIKLMYGDKTYNVVDGWTIKYYNDTQTRAYSASFKGITKEKVRDKDDYYLEIGEWDALGNVPYTTMIIQWADGSQDEIGIKCDVDVRPVQRAYFLNGNKINAMSVPIGQIVIYK